MFNFKTCFLQPHSTRTQQNIRRICTFPRLFSRSESTKLRSLKYALLLQIIVSAGHCIQWPRAPSQTQYTLHFDAMLLYRTQNTVSNVKETFLFAITLFIFITNTFCHTTGGNSTPPFPLCSNGKKSN